MHRRTAPFSPALLFALTMLTSLAAWPGAAKAERARHYIAEIVIAIDGQTLATPSLTLAGGQTASIEDIQAGYRLQLQTARNVEKRAAELFQIDLSKEDHEHSLVEAEIFLKDTADNEWIKIASPVLLSKIGVPGAVTLQPGKGAPAMETLSFKATITRLD